MPRANWKTLSASSWRVPPLSTQRRIAAILSAYDDLIENSLRRIEILEEMARNLYREWFVKFRFPGHAEVRIVDGVPEGSEPRTLGESVQVVKKSVRPTDFREDDVHVGLELIPRRSFTLATWEPVDGVASAKWRFRAGDILFCKIRPCFHKVGFAVRGGLASSDAIVLRVPDAVDWPLVLCATSSDHFVAVASKTVREGSKMPRADWQVLKRYVIAKPPPGVLRSFNDAIRTISTQCKTLALRSRALAEARDLLLPKLISADIDVSDLPVRVRPLYAGDPHRITGYRFFCDIAALPFVEKIALFGSRARADHEERSDIDLCVFCGDAGEDEWSEVLACLEWDRVDTLLKVDCVRFETSNAVLRENVLTEGIVLFERREGP